MTEDAATEHPGHSTGRSRGAVVVTVGTAACVAVVALLWSKRLPYGERVGQLAGTGTWSGTDILGAGGVRAGIVLPDPTDPELGTIRVVA
jgi:hypothetical protein